ncbi:hypothetical protein OROGR_025779 [Orobanche gracilis]
MLTYTWSGDSKVHGDLILAKIASGKLLELDPRNGLNYMLSSNLYAGVEKREDATKMRKLKGKGDAMMPLDWGSRNKSRNITTSDNFNEILIKTRRCILIRCSRYSMLMVFDDEKEKQEPTK